MQACQASKPDEDDRDACESGIAEEGAEEGRRVQEGRGVVFYWEVGGWERPGRVVVVVGCWRKLGSREGGRTGEEAGRGGEVSGEGGGDAEDGVQTR